MIDILCSRVVSREEIGDFARRFVGTRLFIGPTDTHVSLTTRCHICLETAINEAHIDVWPEQIVAFYEVKQTPPLSLIRIEGWCDRIADVIRELCELFDGVEPEGVWELRRKEPRKSDDLQVRGRLYGLWAPPYGGWGGIEKIQQALDDQGWRRFRPTRSFVLPLREAGLEAHIHAIMFLFHFADQTYLFKHGEKFVRFNFRVADVLRTVRNQPGILPRLEAETGDSLIPVGITESTDDRGVPDNSDIIAIGNSGWFYRAGYREPGETFYAEPIGENVDEAMTYMYRGG